MRSVVDSPEAAETADVAAPAAPADEEFSEESARRMVLLALGALVAFVLCAGIALAITRADDGDGDGEELPSADAALTGTGTGPLAGTDVATYVEGRNRALREARGRWVAVVSFRDYVTEGQFKALYESYDVEALLVATAAGEPQVVSGPLSKWATQARTDAEEERRQLESMRATTDDKAFQDQFGADIDRLGKLLAALDPAKPVIFGMVVSGSADQLRVLAAKPEVRLVDLVARRPPESVERLRGLRPEETVKAADPHTRPA